MPIMSRPAGDATTLPFVREAVRRRLFAIAHEIGGLIDFQPHHRIPGTEGGILLMERNLLVMCTSQFRPLGWDLAEDICLRHGLDILLLRFDAYQATFDLCMHSRSSWLSHYHGWSANGELWFVPHVDDGSPYVRAGRYGLLFTDHPPFANARQREAGFAAGCPWDTAREVRA
ncbi:hypothetical protein M527_13460 [Sphingobium indicum IP26]|nr:hypothetical protein M527_24545 [Sphingobium indicum IP26]EPR18246.1 hypothetical protein M527_13460 [Sphingobium indicum IP26]